MTYYVNNELAMSSLFKSFMWTWEDKKHIILALFFFFAICHEMDPSNSQSIPKYRAMYLLLIRRGSHLTSLIHLQFIFLTKLWSTRNPSCTADILSTTPVSLSFSLCLSCLHILTSLPLHPLHKTQDVITADETHLVTNLC